MACRLFTDCLNDIFEYLEEDKISLHSCLLVNRLWCKVAVRILWGNVWNFQYNVYYPDRIHVPLSSTILSTLIACLPNESKDLLHKNGIFIPTPTSKPPLFNYISFIKVLSIRRIDQVVDQFNNKYLVSQELLKAFMNQINSLKSLDYNSAFLKTIQYIPFIYFPGAKNCLRDISEFSCDSNIGSEFFSRTCHQIQSLTINFRKNVSTELKELISAQTHLKSLGLMIYGNDFKDIIPVLTKHHNTLTKLHVYDEGVIPLL